MSEIMRHDPNAETFILPWGRQARLLKESQYEASVVATKSFVNILKSRAGAAEANAIIEATTEVEKRYIDGLSALGRHYEAKAQNAGPIESAMLADAIPDTQARARAMIDEAQRRITRK